MEFVINLAWDPEARVWIAESDDVPGLVMESGSFDALVERLRFAVPELLALNSSDSWDAVKEAPPDAFDLQMIRDAQDDPDCRTVASEAEVKAVLGGI